MRGAIKYCGSIQLVTCNKIEGIVVVSRTIEENVLLVIYICGQSEN